MSQKGWELEMSNYVKYNNLQFYCLFRKKEINIIQKTSHHFKRLKMGVVER